MNLWIYGAGKDRERKKVTSTHTTRYVTLLNVVLALALTVALVACGSDEPSGVTGPDRTASTPGSGDVPTATVAPRPTAAPLAASDSAKTDRVALVALYNATGGDNWADNDTWLSDAPLGEWKGVTTNVDGRVTPLGLSSNELSGGIPAGAGQPLQPDGAVPQQQQVERGDTGGAGRPLQPGRAVARRQRLERVRAKHPGRRVGP